MVRFGAREMFEQARVDLNPADRRPVNSAPRLKP